MADPKTTLTLSGDASNLASCLQESTQNFKKFANDIKAETSGIQGSISNITAPFTALKAGFAAVTAAVLAVGAAIQASLTSTQEWTLGINKLATVMSVSLAKATGYAVVAKEMGLSTDDLTNAAAKLETRILKNGDTFKKWGVSVTDSKGNLLSTGEVMEGMASKYQSLGSQQEKNAFLAETMGKAWKDFAPMMQLSAEKIAHANQMVGDFNLTVSKEGVKAAKDYRTATADVDLAFQGIAKTVSDAFMPQITDLKNGFTELAADVLPAVTWAARAFATALAWTVNLFKTLGINAAEVFDVIKDGLVMVGSVIAKVIKGDIQGAVKAAKAGMKEMADDAEAYNQQILASDKAYEERYKQIWSEQKKDKEEAHKGGKAPGEAGEEASLMDKLKQRLEQIRKDEADKLGIDKDYYERSKAADYAYWEKVLATSKATGKERVGIENEVNTARKAMKTQAFEQNKAFFEMQLAASKHNYDSQILLATKNYNDIVAIEGARSAHALEAQKKLVELQEKQKETIKKVNGEVLTMERAHNDALVSMDIERLNWEKSQGQISEREYLTQLKGFEDKKYQLEVATLNKKLSLNKGDLEETTKTNAEISKLQDKHLLDEQKNQQQLFLISGTAGQGFVAGLRASANAAKSVYQQFAEFGKQMQNDVANSLGKMFTDMLTKGTSFGQAMKTMWKSLATEIVSSLMQMASHYLIDLAIKKTMASFETADAAKKKVDAAAQVTTEQAKAGAVAAGATQTVTALGTVAATAATTTAAMIDLAAAETWAAYAAMPFIGEGLAAAQIGVMQGALGEVKAFASGFSAFAKGGLVTEPTMGLIGEAGEDELIAPKSDFITVAKDIINDVMNTTSRGMAYASNAAGFGSTPSSGNGGNQGDTIHIHMENSTNVCDSVSATAFFGGVIQKTLNTYNRKYA